MKPWRRCKPGMFRRVDFALGPAIVELLTAFVYRCSLDQKGGRVYHVRDVATGHMDFVGVEYLEKVTQ